MIYAYMLHTDLKNGIICLEYAGRSKLMLYISSNSLRVCTLCLSYGVVTGVVQGAHVECWS